MKRALLAAAMAPLLLIAACGGGDEDKPKFTGFKPATYHVSSPNQVVVTYSIGNSIQQERVLPPWSTIASFDGRPGQFYSISAQNQGASGSVRVSIVYDGRTLNSATSSAPYGVASTSATCCD